MPATAAQPGCKPQLINPAGRSYATDSVIETVCSENHCGLLPLGSRNYWVYLDSFFTNGIFDRVQTDTLRFNRNYLSLADSLIWWQPNLEAGYPELLYTNDSTLFKMEGRFFNTGMEDVRPEFMLFSGDSTRYISSFSDMAAICRSLKVQESVSTPAGIFEGCIFVDKLAPYFRHDQLILKPGVGIVRYTQEKTEMGSRKLLLQQTSTLIGFHIE